MPTKFLRLTLCTALLSLPAICQTLGTINGEVTDPSGSTLVEAKVTITNPLTNLTRTTTSNADGNYSFPDLPPGTYSIKAEKEGFQGEVRSDVELQVQQTARIDFHLMIGSVTETVEVTGGAPLLNTENASVGTVIETKRIEDLPLNGRSFVSLVALSPNVVTGTTSNGGLAATRNGTQRAGESVVIAGMRRTYIYYTMDGVSNTDVDFNTYAFLPSIDALQEFKVQTGLYSAEFGRETAQVNVSTKSGTNEYHGTLYEFLRNNHLDARPFAFTSRVPASAPLKENQYGLAIGGPASIPKLFNAKDRLFFFSNWEGFELRQQAQVPYSVPSVAMRTGDFSGLLASGKIITDPLNGNKPFAGNIIPTSRLSSIGLGLLAYYPTPNIPGAGLVNNYLALDNNTASKTQFTQRLDYIQNTRSTWFGRYSWQNESSVAPALFENGNSVNTHVQQAVLSNIFIISPTLVNEFHTGYLGFTNSNLQDGAYQTNVDAALGIPFFPQAPISYGTPNVVIAGFSTFGDSVQGPFNTNDHTFEWTDNISWNHGKHALKFGVDVRHDRYNEAGNQNARGQLTIQNQATGYGFADYMLGYLSQSRDVGGLGQMQLRQTSMAFYVSDSWKVRPNLTIEAGLRYEHYPPWYDKGDNMMSLLTPVFTTQPNSTLPHPFFARDCAAYGQDSFYPPESMVRFNSAIHTACVNNLGTTLVRADNLNFAPRLGIAWSPSQKWTVRLGAGIFFAQEISDTYLDTARNSAGRTQDDANIATHNLTFANPFNVSAAAQACGVPSPPYTCVSNPLAFTNDPNNRTPYVEQWELNVQRQLTNSMVLEAGYLGSAGHHLQTDVLWDTAVPGTTGTVASRSPFPEINTNQVRVGNVNSNYEAGTLKLTRRLSAGLTALIGYTYSKSLDNGSSTGGTEANLSLTKPQAGYCISKACGEYGPSNFDSRHRFVASVLYELPFGKGKQFLSKGIASNIVGGWQLNSIVTISSGFPLEIGDGLNQSNTNVSNDRPNATGVSAQLNHPTTGEWFNLAAVQLQPFGTFGNLARNSITGPGVFDWDFSTFKNFYITEQRYLQFRFECFNCANHPNFGDPGILMSANTINSAGFAVPGTGTFGEITSTRPGIDMRELQFSLKLIF